MNVISIKEIEWIQTKPLEINCSFMYKKWLLKSLFIFYIFFLFRNYDAHAQQVFNLYPDGQIPNSINVPDSEYLDTLRMLAFKVSHPTLTVYYPDKQETNGTAVIVCPGGGYANELVKWEGSDIAHELIKKGITAFVLKYRLPSDVTMKNKSIGPLQDAQQAIYQVRTHAKEWGIDSSKVGIVGFSAGGHLASTAATHFDRPVIDAHGINLRPDFAILVYPVISMKEKITHPGSRKRLLGDHPSRELEDLFSNDLQVNQDTPPTFLVVAQDDKVVPIENSLRFFHRMLAYQNPVSLHFYEKGGHGFKKIPPRSLWMTDLFYWMGVNDWL